MSQLNLFEVEEVPPLSNEDLYHNSNYSEQTEEVKDKVINPSYYQDVVPGYQYIQLMEHLLPRYEDPFVAGVMAHIYSYAFRLGQKDSLEQDTTKLAWYAAYLADYAKRKAAGQTPYQPS